MGIVSHSMINVNHAGFFSLTSCTLFPNQHLCNCEGTTSDVCAYIRTSTNYPYLNNLMIFDRET